MAFDLDMIQAFYEGYSKKVEATRKMVDHPLTLIEKILYAHLWQGNVTEQY